MLEYASAFNKQTNLFPAVSAQSHPIHLLESGTNLWLCSPCFCDLWCPYCTCMNALRALGVTLESICVLHWLLKCQVCSFQATQNEEEGGDLSLQWVLSSALLSPLIPINDPGKSVGSSHQWLHGSVERGICASGAFLLVCPTEAMD